ncbi:MAG: hypothetical protein ACOYLQ_16050 [Hyphomicrobiaceae bacterium]
MRSIEELAEFSVARGCGFGLIAIGTFVVGLSDDMVLALKAGGLMLLMMAVILLIRAKAAQVVSHKRTEIWVMMPVEQRPPPGIAQKVIATVLRDVYLKYALQTAVGAGGLLIASMVLAALR